MVNVLFPAIIMIFVGLNVGAKLSEINEIPYWGREFSVICFNVNKLGQLGFFKNNPDICGLCSLLRALQLLSNERIRVIQTPYFLSPKSSHHHPPQARRRRSWVMLGNG
jgi:hypothetical protein